MRAALDHLGVPDHLALAYDAWAPVGLTDGRVPDSQRPGWLAKLARLRVSPDYVHAFNRWKHSFKPPGDRLFELTLGTRLLVGHGNASATDVGLTIHHTWGVPVIPGSALKGLMAHYVDAVYGPDDPDLAPWEQPDEEQRERARYQGVTWKGRRIARGPGEFYRILFGSPDAELDAVMRDRGLKAGASKGVVTFHDALYVPESAPEDKPYAVDVVTVHQKSYYNSAGASWPNDYDRPNPVAFLTVRPGARMLFALSGPPDWAQLAEGMLRDALSEWGVGAKTSAGYGRLVPPEDRSTSQREAEQEKGVPSVLKPGQLVQAVLLEERTRKGGWKARHEPSGLSGHIQNSGDVPADAQPGELVELVVASVSSREVAFRFPARTQDSPLRKRKKR